MTRYSVDVRTEHEGVDAMFSPQGELDAGLIGDICAGLSELLGIHEHVSIDLGGISSEGYTMDGYMLHMVLGIARDAGNRVRITNLSDDVIRDLGMCRMGSQMEKYMTPFARLQMTVAGLDDFWSQPGPEHYAEIREGVSLTEPVRTYPIF